MVLQLVLYFGGLVTFAVALITYFAAKRAWPAPAILMPMFVFVSYYSVNQQTILWIGAGFSLLGYLVALTIKILVQRDRQQQR
ncbi:MULTISPECIES: hypothetical protein [Aneurinibacillus]|jgi:hypothetical protein|uniref:Uncharacterized protein n=1 Tax=Aneurinibacillus danicus TaxID=267746 RepID=A0A511V9G5_9BACL|nr:MULTISPECIES: hypothetical protein [Aneurinibacillus]GEN35567.1 hypothetical protein ADA01nite_30270 [Aneurinibacillus danicus]